MTEEHSHQQVDIDNLILSLPIEEKVPIVAIKKLLDQRKTLDEQMEQQIRLVNEKFGKLFDPINKRASEIIRGGSIKEEELKTNKSFFPQGINATHLKGKRIDNYWGACLANSKLSDLITQQDEKALMSLVDIQVVRAKDCITLIFEFQSNQYIKNKTLKRELIYEDGQPRECKGDLIHWKQNKNLAYEMKKVVNKKTGQSKLVESNKKKPSFFHFFANNNPTESQEAIQHLQVQAAIFNDLASEIIPYSIEYYLGVADYQTEFNDSLSGQEQEDEEDDLIEQDDEVDNQPTKKRK